LQVFLLVYEVRFQHPQKGNSSYLSSWMLVVLVSRLTK
jgi:hypothetical protein